VHSFIGYARYYRCFIEFFSNITFPLFQSLPKDAEFVWKDECEKTFVKIKELVCKAPIYMVFTGALVEFNFEL